MKTKGMYLASVVMIVLLVLTTGEIIQARARDNAGFAQKKSKPAIIDASRFPNLQAAIDAVPESGGEVIIPPGNYELSKPLVLSRQDTHIKGAGTSTHIINRNENGEPALIIRPANDSDPKSFIWRIQLSDFRVSGNPGSGDAISFERVNELFLSGLMVDHNGGNGISLTRCPENPRINHCNITYNAKAGIHVVACDDVVISANQFEENQDALQFIDGYNLTMTGNNIDDHLRYGIVVENTYGSVISGNMIEECNSTAVILDRDCYGITLSSNVIADDGSGIELRDACGCTVSANTFVMVFNFSILVGPQSSRNVITGNNFANSYIGDGKTKRPEQVQNFGPVKLGMNGGTGIILNGTSDIAISGNVFGGLFGEAVRADEKCSRISVTGNIMTDLGRRSPDHKIAIDLGGAIESVAKDNIIESGLLVNSTLNNLSSSAASATSGNDSNKNLVIMAMRKAAQYFVNEVSTNGGYLFNYKSDFSMREGEEIASPTTIWVQPPGTPAIGLAFLEAYEVTGETLYLDAAISAARALVWGQLASGGWDYRIDFDPELSKRWHYRRDIENGDTITGKRRNQSTLDDNTTQCALQLLMKVDKILGFKDSEIHRAANYGLNALLKVQYPNGAWPQRFTAPPDPKKFPVIKAHYPDSWSREFTGIQYQNYYTFNDNSISDVIETMIEAYKIYGNEKYLNAAKRCGDFIILAQMPEPQPAWAQQYNENMEPAWARKFEPPAITGGETFGILRTLLFLYLETGEKRFLEPVPKALRWAENSLLNEKQLARFYELKTNKPLYFNAPRQYSALAKPAFPSLKDYTLIYEDTDLPNHYSFKVSSAPIASIKSEYNRIKEQGREIVLAERDRIPAADPEKVNEVIRKLDDKGRWIEKGRLKTGEISNPYVQTDIISCDTFIRNFSLLTTYIKNNSGNFNSERK